MRSSGKVTVVGNTDGNTTTLQTPDGEVTRLRADVARLEAENGLLREHNAFLQDLTGRLVPMLPSGPHTTSQESEVPRRAWWRRLFGGD